MKYPFLTNNELILFDYLPGGSGQLLMRIWSELDIKLDYTNTKILSDIPINSHKSSREIAYEIIVPKRITNWFLDRCEPNGINDYVQFFEFLGTHLLAGQQQWNWGDTKLKFYENSKYEMKNYRISYGIHSWNKTIVQGNITESQCVICGKHKQPKGRHMVRIATGDIPYDEYYENGIHK